MLIVASPSNPTGTTVSEAEMQALAHYCHVHGIRLISDEIYHGIVFGGEIVTAAACSDSAIVINSFSKYFSMTGWRLGYAAGSEEIIAAMTQHPILIERPIVVKDERAALGRPPEQVLDIL